MERRLAATLAFDMVAYSRLVETDETGTFTRLTKLRNELTDPAIGHHGGRGAQGTGDGVLAEFASTAGVNVAARIESLADPGGILIFVRDSPSTKRFR